MEDSAHPSISDDGCRIGLASCLALFGIEVSVYALRLPPLS